MQAKATPNIVLVLNGSVDRENRSSLLSLRPLTPAAVDTTEVFEASATGWSTARDTAGTEAPSS